MKFIKTGVSKLYILVLILILCCTGIGSAAFIHTTIGDIGSSGTAGSPSLVDVARVARKNSNGEIEWTTYKTVEEALDFANQSGDVVTIIPGSFASIHGECEINDGVTLAIPIEDKNIDATSLNGNNDEYYHVNSSSQPTVSLTYTIENTLTLKSGATLTLGGSASLVVYGQLSGGNGGGDYSGQPFGKISTLNLEDNTNIICQGEGSKIIAYGIIRDVRTNTSLTQGKISMANGTELKTPYVLRDFKGGSVSAAIYKETKGLHVIVVNYTPKNPIYMAAFYQFQVLNVEPIIEMNYGSTLTAIVNINAGDQKNNKLINFIGTSSSSFLQMTNSTYSKIICDYDQATEISDVTIVGGARLNGMDISMEITLVGTMSFNTADYVYPLSWRHRIKLEKGVGQTAADFIIPQDFKCLPGSYFEVGQGCTLTSTGILSVLDYGTAGNNEYFNDTAYQEQLHKYCIDKYPESKKPATFINHGNLVLKSAGGNIQAGSEGATLIATGSNNAVTYEATTYSGSSAWTVINSYETKTNPLRGATAPNGTIETLSANLPYVANSNKQWVFEESLKLSPNTISFNTSETATITMTIRGLEDYSPQIETSSAALTYSLSEPTVNSTTRTRTYTITLNATDDGDYTIEAACGNKTDICYVKVDASVVSVTGVSLNRTSAEITEGDTLQLTATVSPSDATNKNVTWTSSNTNVATVSSTGLVTAKVEGNATITATTVDGNKTATCSITVKASSSGGGGGCLVEGTLITMADGTKVPVENVKAGDELLVFNHETGQYDVAPVLFNDSEPLNKYNVIYLEFADGNKVGVVYEHGFFDITTMQYEYITEDNYEQFIGHEFVNAGDGDNFSTTKLINAYVVTENVRVYSPVTKYHLNYFTEDMLSMPGGIKGLFNIFEMDEDLSYNEEAKAKDIETYGLFTYEDFKDYVSYEIYESFPAAYFKVSLGKGLMTWEDLLYYIERYAPLM